MFRKLRYGIVAAAGILVIAGTAVISGFLNKGTTENTEDAELGSFGVSDFTYDRQGNSVAEVDEYGVSIYDAQESVGSVSGLRLEDAPSLGAGESMTAAAATEAEELSSEASDHADASEEETLADDETETADKKTDSKKTDSKKTDSADRDDTVDETEEETTEAIRYFGLRGYFKDKLIIDTEKVELWLNVREEPDNDSRVVSVLYANDIVTVLEELDHWYRIEGPDYTGYVSADYVLTGMDAYDIMADSVAYAVMVSEDEAMLYAEPDNTGVKILAGQKSDTFRTVGMSGDYYEVEVISDVYDTLYIHKDDVILYYLFLGRGNDNEMSEAYEAYFGTLEIADNLEKSAQIAQQVKADWEAYESYLESEEEASKAAEASYAAAVQASKDAQNANAAAQTQQVAQQASVSGEAQYLGTFKITHYCHCPKCCGIWGSNDPNYTAYGASGMRLVSDYTVAINAAKIPYGTRLLINGREYITADDAGYDVIDIYRSTHDAALAGGCYYAEVYVLP